MVFLCIAFIPSVIGAISGVGGGIIIKPVLDLVVETPFIANALRVPHIDITGIHVLSGCTVLVMSCVSLLKNRAGGIKIETGKAAALVTGSVLGGLGGKFIFSFAVSALAAGNIVAKAQSGILIIMTGGVILYLRVKKSIRTLEITWLPLRILLGLIMGLLSAFLGIGGGPINIIVLSFFLSMDSKAAAVYSLFIIFFSQCSSLVLTVLSKTPPAVPLPVLAAMIAGGVAGGLTGSVIARRMCNEQVDRLFNILLVLVIAVSAYNFFGFK
jgi:uncharacterized membrane protein YfcA